MPNSRLNNRSEEVQDILTKTPNSLLFMGNSIILGLLVLFFLFTWFIRYPDVITSESVIASKQPPEKIYAQIGGTIASILVQDNQMVSPQQTLAVLQNTANYKDVFFLKQALDTLNLKLAAHQMLIDKFQNLKLGSISASFTMFQKAILEYSLNNSLDPYSNQIKASVLSYNELQLRLSNLFNQKDLDKQKLELVKNEFERYKILYKKGVISLNEYEAKQLRFLELQKSQQQLDLNISQLNQAINEANKNIKDTQINNQMEDSRLFKNLIQANNELLEAILIWEQNYVLKSTVSGKVSFLTLWNPNQRVNSGDLIGTVIPNNNNQYFVKIKAPIQNSGKIKKGQDVLIQLYNYPQEEYGMLEANIESMSAIPNEEGYYLINASLVKALVTSYQIEIPFRNEMSGSAQIITEDLRLLERFFYQLRGLF